MNEHDQTEAAKEERYRRERDALYEVLRSSMERRFAIADPGHTDVEESPGWRVFLVLERMLERGRKEGYPECCIRQYIIDFGTWDTGSLESGLMKHRRRVIHPETGHIMCDECLAEFDASEDYDVVMDGICFGHVRKVV